jgi:AbiV family abortive infection protein
VKSYRGDLTAVQAANAIRAARLNALELLDTAEILADLKRFAHAMAFATLAIEEASKVPIVFSNFLGLVDRRKSWEDYRSHRAKTTDLDIAIYGRIRAHFPKINPEKAAAIADDGPTPDQLEEWKQLAVYSDCLETEIGFTSHLPSLAEWRELAGDRLAEAKALVYGLRDRTPPELEIFRRHFDLARSEGRAYETIIEAVHAELVEKRLIRSGSWDSLLSDVKRWRGESEPPPG